MTTETKVKTEMAHKAGRAAFIRGTPRNDNPHDLDSPCGRAWRLGWTEAHTEFGGRWDAARLGG